MTSFAAESSGAPNNANAAAPPHPRPPIPKPASTFDTASSPASEHSPHTDSQSSSRFLVEFAVLTTIAIMAVRTFIAETYVVPSGSMAATLLGHHKEAHCPGCGYEFAVGWEENERLPDTVACPNCLYPHLPIAETPLTGGDRLLVQKGLYAYRRPARWEPVVFQHPKYPRQAWVKRVAALPGESIQIQAGDIYIDGQIARKTWEQFCAGRAPVYDSSFTPADPDLPLPARFKPVEKNTGWRVDAGRLIHEGNVERSTPEQLDRVEYIHRDYGALENSVRDESPYNADRPHWDYDLVTDLAVTAQIDFHPDESPCCQGLVIGLRISPDLEFALHVFRAANLVELRDVPKTVPAGFGMLDPQKKRAWSENSRRVIVEGLNQRRSVKVEFGLIDQTVWARIDGKDAFFPVELDGRIERRRQPKTTSSRPIYFECLSGKVAVTHVRIDRDIHYGGRVAGTIHPAGVGKPYHLGPDEFFMLGDNSAISNDSRGWEHPAVAQRFLLGKPILAHQPARVRSTTLLGRTLRLPGWPFRDLRLVR